MVMRRDEELRAAYERIEELVTLLRRVRSYVVRAEGCPDVIEVTNDIDDALTDGVTR